MRRLLDCIFVVFLVIGLMGFVMMLGGALGQIARGGQP